MRSLLAGLRLLLLSAVARADTSGILFKEHFESLNVNGLFETGKQARDYVTRYESQDWTETGPYVIAEVKAPK
jgi:hypothetical protein